MTATIKKEEKPGRICPRDELIGLRKLAQTPEKGAVLELEPA